MLCAFAISSLFLHSCKKDSDSNSSSNNPPPGPSSSFTAKIGGQDWTSATTSAIYRYGIFVLTGKSSDGKTIVIRTRPMLSVVTRFPIYLTYGSTDDVGIYMEGTNDSLAFATNQMMGVNVSTLSFSKFDTVTKQVSGSFSMTVRREIDDKEKVITGTFTDVVYDNQIPPTPSKTMTAKVNNSNWAAVSVLAIDMFGSISITGNAANGTTIRVTVPSTVKAGQTSSLSTFGSSSAQYNPDASTFKSAISGSVTITEHDIDAEVIRGTFNFIAGDSPSGGPNDTITNGSFVTTY